MVNKNVLSCLLKDGKEVNAVMLVGSILVVGCIITVLLLISCFYCSVFRVLGLFAMCTIVSFVMFFDVRLSHLNKDYLLTYLK